MDHVFVVSCYLQIILACFIKHIADPKIICTVAMKRLLFVPYGSFLAFDSNIAQIVLINLIWRKNEAVWEYFLGSSDAGSSCHLYIV